MKEASPCGWSRWCSTCGQRSSMFSSAISHRVVAAEAPRRLAPRTRDSSKRGSSKPMQKVLHRLLDVPRHQRRRWCWSRRRRTGRRPRARRRAGGCGWRRPGWPGIPRTSRRTRSPARAASARFHQRCGLHAGARELHPGAGHDVAHALPDGPRRRDVVEAQVVVDRLQVEPSARRRARAARQHRLDLGGEHQRARRRRATYSGLTPMRSRTRYIASSRASSMAMANMPLSRRRKAMPSRSYRRRMHLGVGVRAQLHALRAQLGGQFDVVEDLAVLHHGDPAVVGDEGLVAAGDVDDGQAPVADARRRAPAGCQMPSSSGPRCTSARAIAASCAGGSALRGRGPSSRRCRTSVGSLAGQAAQRPAAGSAGRAARLCSRT